MTSTSVAAVPKEKCKEDKKSIVFFHPDLGIGGAERLVIDAAVGLQELGHKVTIFTSYCDKNHCFEEARDGTLDVRVRGTLFPQTIAGRFSILCAILRQLHLVLVVSILTPELDMLRPTHFVLDQLSAAVPWLSHMYDKVGILFYCHFPDQLLVQKEGNEGLALVKSAYRIPFNFIESWSTAAADGIVVNSKFTANTVKRVFPTLSKRDLKVIYPCVDISAAKNSEKKKSLWPDRNVFLSINRFEKKKDVALAVKAFAGLETKERKNALLVIAGGHDPRIPENVHTHVSLQELADSLKLTHTTYRSADFHPSEVSPETDILFLLSFSDKQKQDLLASSDLLVYTPQNEHFGIVPLEAMLAGLPVLAADEGGPLETVVEGKTGWLRDVRQPSQWTAIMLKVLDFTQGNNGRRLLENMATAGKERVVDEFSKESMAKRFDASLDELATSPRIVYNSEDHGPNYIKWFTFIAIYVAVIAFALTQLALYMIPKHVPDAAYGGGSSATGTAVPTFVREEL